MLTPLQFLADFLLPNDRCSGLTTELRRVIFDFSWISTPTEALDVLRRSCEGDADAGEICGYTFFETDEHGPVNHLLNAIRKDPTDLLLLDHDVIWFHTVTHSYAHLRLGPAEAQLARAQALCAELNELTWSVAFPHDADTPTSDLLSLLRIGSIRQQRARAAARDARICDIIRDDDDDDICMEETRSNRRRFALESDELGFPSMSVVMAVAATTCVNWGEDKVIASLFDFECCETDFIPPLLSILLNRMREEVPADEFEEICKRETCMDRKEILLAAMSPYGLEKPCGGPMQAATMCLLQSIDYTVRERAEVFDSWLDTIDGWDYEDTTLEDRRTMGLEACDARDLVSWGLGVSLGWLAKYGMDTSVHVLRARHADTLRRHDFDYWRHALGMCDPDVLRAELHAFTDMPFAHFIMSNASYSTSTFVTWEDACKRDGDGDTLIQYALKRGLLRWTRSFLDIFPLENVDGRGFSLLQLCAAAGHHRSVGVMCDAGARIFERTMDGKETVGNAIMRSLERVMSLDRDVVEGYFRYFCPREYAAQRDSGRVRASSTSLTKKHMELHEKRIDAAMQRAAVQARTRERRASRQQG